MQLYEVQYESPTGPVASIQPAAEGVPAAVQKQTYRGNTLASSTGGQLLLGCRISKRAGRVGCQRRACSSTGRMECVGSPVLLFHQFALSLDAARRAHLLCLLCLLCAVVSRRMAWENIYMAEVVRSCPEMCRQDLLVKPLLSVVGLQCLPAAAVPTGLRQGSRPEGCRRHLP